MLSKGRVDAVAGAIPVLKYIANLEGLSERALDKPLIFITTEVYFMCTIKVKKTIRNKLKIAIDNLKKNGQIQGILDKYFAPQSE